MYLAAFLFSIFPILSLLLLPFLPYSFWIIFPMPPISPLSLFTLEHVLVPVMGVLLPFGVYYAYTEKQMSHNHICLRGEVLSIRGSTGPGTFGTFTSILMICVLLGVPLLGGWVSMAPPDPLAYVCYFSAIILSFVGGVNYRTSESVIERATPQ